MNVESELLEKIRTRGLIFGVAPRFQLPSPWPCYVAEIDSSVIFKIPTLEEILDEIEKRKYVYRLDAYINYNPTEHWIYRITLGNGASYLEYEFDGVAKNIAALEALLWVLEREKGGK